jgi:S1-C subfamily serine protease
MKNIFCGGLRCLTLTCVFILGLCSGAAHANDLRTASVYVDAGRLAEAVALLKTYQATDEEEYKVNLLTGKIYLAIDKPAKALEFFEVADTLSLENIEAQVGVALCQLKLGKFTIAKRYADSIKRLERDSGEPLYINGLIQARIGKFEAAIKEFEQTAQRQPDSENIAIAQAKFFVATDNLDKAKTGLTEFIRRKPEAAGAMEYLSQVLYKLGDLSGAANSRLKALKLFTAQGNQYQADVATAWLQVNDPASRASTPKSDPDSLPKKKRDDYAEKKKSDNPINTVKPVNPVNPDKTKFKPSISESEQAFAVHRFPFPPDVTITGGSGFIVDSGRKIVTNRHVVEGGKQFAIRTGLGEVIKAKLIYVSSTDDLAVLELDKALPANRSIPSNSYVKPKVGRNVVVMGYPLWYILGEGSPSLTNGVVSKRTGLQDDQGTFQVTAKVNKGNSGGPVFDMRGNVVGITVGKLDLKKISDDQGFLPEDVNFAIHVDRLPKIVGISTGAEETRAELSAEDLYQAMVDKVVMVATYK